MEKFAASDVAGVLDLRFYLRLIRENYTNDRHTCSPDFHQVLFVFRNYILIIITRIFISLVYLFIEELNGELY